MSYTRTRVSIRGTATWRSRQQSQQAPSTGVLMNSHSQLQPTIGSRSHKELEAECQYLHMVVAEGSPILFPPRYRTTAKKLKACFQFQNVDTVNLRRVYDIAGSRRIAPVGPSVARARLDARAPEERPHTPHTMPTPSCPISLDGHARPTRRSLA